MHRPQVGTLTGYRPRGKRRMFRVTGHVVTRTQKFTSQIKNKTAFLCDFLQSAAIFSGVVTLYSTVRRAETAQSVDGLTARVRFPARQDFFFAITSRPALGPNQPPNHWVPGSKRPGREVTTHLLLPSLRNHFSTECKERKPNSALSKLYCTLSTTQVSYWQWMIFRMHCSPPLTV
jgi:hypothetical protein